ncbi:MAG: GTPase Era [Pyrinomonadaceae bacterium]
MNTENSQLTDYRSGYAALIGRPNAGKSTLLNRLVGEKIAAVSNKPQTTRHRIQGVITRPAGQIVLVDTPGVHQPGYLLNRRMMSAVYDALEGVDLLLLIRDAAVPTGNGDRFVLDLVRKAQQPALLLLNKIDRLDDKSRLLSLIEFYSAEREWQSVIPISARKGEMVDVLVAEIIKNLPVGDPIFDADDLTDQPLRILVAEIVREKILQTTGDELPYVTAVITEKYDEERPDFTRIHCAIFVERPTQKKIIIGHGAERLKEIGTQARHDIERLLGHRVFLELFVKVEENWRNSERALSEMGIENLKKK